LALENKIITFMENLWVSIEDTVVTIGVLESGLEDATEIYHVDLPTENSEIEGEEICGEVHTDDGPVNLYSPVSGIVLEINSAIIANPKMLFEDSEGDCWLFKVDASDEDDIARFTKEASDDEMED
jgi:glycine cleavage system H protein